jgi:hypothetical protein
MVQYCCFGFIRAGDIAGSVMKSFCLLAIGVILVVWLASLFSTEAWAYRVCSNAFGMCDYRMALGIGGLGFVGLFFALNEIPGR